MKLATFILSFTILIQSFHVGFSDLLQLNELIEHAQFHQKEYGDDFLTFFSKHYGNLKEEHAKNHKEESQKHEKLPFNEHQHINLVDFQVVPFNTIDFLVNKTIFISKKSTTFFYNILYNSIFKKGVFQPPRLA